MGFLTKILTAAVKTTLSPVAIVKDAVDVATGEEPKNTSNLLESVEKDLEDSVDAITGENDYD